MAWLYVPGLAGFRLDLHLSYQTTAPFVMSRGNPMLPASLRRAWRKGGWIRRLSGLTCEPFTAHLGVAKWTSSLPDIHASRSASLESDKEQKIIDTYGRTSV